MSEMASRAGWTRVAFGDVVRLSRERSSHPGEDSIERYVGLDHLEPGNLKIRRWGDVGDGTTFTNVFHPGQVLFGKRRAYQRKVAVADFDGVCSGDIYVLEPSTPALLPDLLPFICQTDGFFEHAVGTSAGSLSPRTNWTSLATYELGLPPLREQLRIVRLMQAVEGLRGTEELLGDQIRTLRSSFSVMLFGKANATYPSRKLGDSVTHSAYGPRFPADRYSDDGNAWTIRTTDFNRMGGITFSTVPSARLDESVVAEHRLVDGDLLLSRSGEYAGMVRIFHGLEAPDKPFLPAAFLIRFRLDHSQLLPEFLFEYCESPLGAQQLRQISLGSAQPNISGSAFMNLCIVLPDIVTQRRMCHQLRRSRTTEARLVKRVGMSTRLATRLSAILLSDGQG